MTAHDLIKKLQQLPEEIQLLPVVLHGSYDGTPVEFGKLITVTCQIGGNKIWWKPETIRLSTEYPTQYSDFLPELHG